MQVIAFKENGIHKTLFIWRPNDTSQQKYNLRKAFNAKPYSEYSVMSQRIEGILCDYGINLSLLFEQFFMEEYDSFEAYLESEENLNTDKIEAILKVKLANESLWKVDISIYEGYGFANLFDEYIWEEDFLVPRLNKILEK